MGVMHICSLIAALACALMAGGVSAQVETPPLCATLGINATFWRKDGSLYAPDSPPYFDEYPFSMPPDTYLATRPSDEELVVSDVNFGHDSAHSSGWESWPTDYNDTYFVVVLESYIELTEGGEYTFFLSNSDQGELELSKDNVTQTAILGAAWSDYEEDHQGTTLILEYDLVPTRYLMRIKYHKASPIDAFGPPYLRLEWTRTEIGVNISASPTERELVPDNVFYLNSMCEGLEASPVPAPAIAPAQAPSVLPMPRAYGYGSPLHSSYGGVAAAPAPSAAFDSELAPETAPMGRGAPTKPLPKSPTPVGPRPRPHVLPRATGNDGEAPETAPSGEAAPTMGVNPFGKPMSRPHSAAAPAPSMGQFKPMSTIPLPKPKPQIGPGQGVLPPPGTPGSYCPAPAIHYHISYNCCPNRGGAYGMTAPPPMTSTNPDSPMSCGTHYDVVPVERSSPVPAITAPQAAPRRRSMAEAQEEPEEGVFVIDVPGSQGAANAEIDLDNDWVEDDRDGIRIEESERFEEEAEDEAEVMATMNRMAEQAQREEADSQVAEILSNDAKFWRDQAAWEATGGLQSSGDVALANEKVLGADADVAPIMDTWSTRLFGGPTGKSIEDAQSTADQSTNHSSLWSYLLHYRETSRNQAASDPVANFSPEP